MKKALIKFLVAYSFINLASAIDLSGTYKCQFKDHSDGDFKAQLSLKLDPQATLTDKGYSSYTLDFTVDGIPYGYTGIAAMHNNNLAIFFESTGDKKNPDDRGVGIAAVAISKNKKGKQQISFHKFYYENSYKGKSNYGFEDCVKSDGDSLNR